MVTGRNNVTEERGQSLRAILIAVLSLFVFFFCLDRLARNNNGLTKSRILNDNFLKATITILNDNFLSWIDVSLGGVRTF